MAANKNELERTLASAISAIHDRLPSLKLYQHIYNENHELDIRLQSEIVAAYQHFIDFCIKATRYYTSSGIRKPLLLCHSTRSPRVPCSRYSNIQWNGLICIETGRWSRAFLPINQFAQEAEEVQNHIVQIRRLCEDLLHKNVDNIKQLNTGKHDEFHKSSSRSDDKTRSCTLKPR